MNLLLLQGYNNYFNRILKKKATIADYKTATTQGNVHNYLVVENINFNPNDGVTTALILGTGNLNWEDNEEHTPDYLVTYTETTVEEVTTQTIKSRWFILEIERTRGGQYRLALKRDILADYESDVMEAPCFVEKGTISDAGNPLLFNSEGMDFNQIKKGEKAIKDESQCAWLVGYLKKGISETVSVSYTPKDVMADTVDISSKDWYQCITYRSIDGIVTPAAKTYYYMNMDTSNFCWKMQVPGNSWPTYVTTAVKLRWDMNGQNRGYSYDVWNGDYQGMSQEAMIINAPWWSMGIDSPYCKRWSDDIINKMLGTNWSLWVALRNNAISEINTHGILTTTTVTDVLKYDGKYFEKDNKIYKLTIAQGNAREEIAQYDSSSVAANALWNCVLPDSRDTGNGVMTLAVATDNPTKPRCKFIFQGLEYSIIAQEEQLPGSISFTMATEANRNNVEDAVYNMFCMPVNPQVLGINSESVPQGSVLPNIRISNGSSLVGYVDTFSQYAMGFSTELCRVLGGNSNASKIYDLQVLPYCPLNLEVKNNVINIQNLTANKDYQLIKNTSNATKGIIFYPDRANFTKNIDLTVPNSHVEYNTLKEFVNPKFEVYVSNWPNPGDIARDEEGNPMLWWTAPFRVANTWDDPAVRTALWDIPPGMETDAAPDGVGFNLVVGTDGSVTVYFSYDRNKPYVAEKVYTGALEIKLDWIIPDNSVENPHGALDIKIANECDFERLVSPNYNGMFEFKRSRLNDGIHYINVDCTYKPYTPYIKLNPDFSGLYGQDWNDSTGLICGGDFSIPMMNDAFTNYALQNKNYQEIFARQIENLDVNQKIAKEQQQFQGIVNIATAGIGGGVAGGLAGAKAGPWGAAIGAVAGAAGGTVASYLGYEKDKDWLEQQQGEARSYAVDQYNYNLGNIKAIPQSMTKSSPLSFNNKIWPILEQYSCTDTEKEVLKNKLKYDGMTIMAIGTLTDYSATGGYLKGKIIRLPNLRDDFHIADAIYQEVDKGFYIGD